VPKRTNEFQKLILAINNHFASKSAKVTESAMLFDPSTEQDREIDILIEDEIGGYKVRIGVECTTVKRPLSVGQLDGLLAKHKDCGINKSVIVSKSGFARTTIRKANKLGVEVISYKAALEKDWPSEFKILSGIKPFHVSCELMPDLPLILVKGSTLDGFLSDENPLVVEHQMTLAEFLLDSLRSETNELMIPPYLNTEQAEKNGVLFSKTWSFNPPVTLKSKNGNEAKILSAEPSYMYRRVQLIGDLKAGIYNQKLVASSVLKTNGLFKESHFTISKDASEYGKGGLSVSLSLNTRC
jgi:hypothetical protein